MNEHNAKMMGDALRDMKTYKDAWQHCIRTTVPFPETQKQQMAAASQGLLGLLLVGWVVTQVCKAGSEGGNEAAMQRFMEIVNEHQQLAMMVGPLDQTTMVQ